MIIGVLLPLPFNEPFDYESEEELPLGTMVRVPFGREEQIGVVWRHGKSSGLDDKRIRTVIEKFNFPPIAEELRRLVEFTAAYNCAPLGLVLKMVISVRHCAKRVKSAERTKLTKQIKRTKRKQGEATNRQRQTDYRSERQRTHVGTNLRAEQLPGIVRLRCSHSWQVSPYDSGGRFRRLVGGGRFGFSVGPGPPRARRAAESCR